MTHKKFECFSADLEFRFGEFDQTLDRKRDSVLIIGFLFGKFHESVEEVFIENIFCISPVWTFPSHIDYLARPDRGFPQPFPSAINYLDQISDARITGVN